MDNPVTHDYLGIYDWQGEPEAEGYVAFLKPILEAVSVPGSVWSRTETNQPFEDFLDQRRLPTPAQSARMAGSAL